MPNSATVIRRTGTNRCVRARCPFPAPHGDAIRVERCAPCGTTARESHVDLRCRAGHTSRCIVTTLYALDDDVAFRVRAGSYESRARATGRRTDLRRGAAHANGACHYFTSREPGRVLRRCRIYLR